MNRRLRSALITSFVGIAIAAVLALAALAAGQFWPEAGGARIQWGEHSTALSTVFDSGVLEFALAWAAITLAILITVAATLFALTVCALALGLAAVVMAFPLILIGGIVWWALRCNRGQQLRRHDAQSAQVHS